MVAKKRVVDSPGPPGKSAPRMRRAGVFGWGVIAPECEDIDEFQARLEKSESWLEPFNGFGPDNFLVGRPKFDFARYQPWIEARFPPSRFKQLTDKMDTTVLYGIGAFIQALGQNPGIEGQLRGLGQQAHVYAGTAIGAFPTFYNTSITYYRAQRRWNRFWSDASRNTAYRAYLDGNQPAPEGLQDPRAAQAEDEREALEDAWFAYWATRSEVLAEYLAELKQAESISVEGDVEAAKLKVIREKHRRLTQVQQKHGAPEAPWTHVSANLLWNISNTPASQISMMGHITGLTFGPMAACSTFGVTLKLALDAIDRGEAKLVVIGTCDPPPHPLTVGAFYGARVLAADGGVSKPLSGMKGTHVAGGAAVWILGDLEWGLAQGFKPLGLEPLAVGVSADADHIITPSKEGPRAAMLSALERAEVAAGELVSWDLHATATPGDFQEVDNLQSVVPPEVLVTARKGTFGHGMGVGGGWELTAQYLGCAAGRLFPTTLTQAEVNDTIAKLGQALVFDRAVEVQKGAAGKLSMGVGGINACVISRPFR
jgi:3-oxoacyl-[acyl-carrier-protein] synthase II